jgi:hypothetical protein
VIKVIKECQMWLGKEQGLWGLAESVTGKALSKL